MSRSPSDQVSTISRALSDASGMQNAGAKDYPAPCGFRAMQSRARHLRNLRIAEMFDAGRSVAQIAKAEHLTPTWVCSILDTTGARRKRKRGSGVPLGEMPEIVDWSGAEVGRFYRPAKRPVTMRLDDDVIDWLKSYGRGYQTKANLLLRHAMKSSQRTMAKGRGAA